MKVFRTADLSKLNKRDRLYVYNGLDTLMTHELHSKIDAMLDSTTRVTSDFSHKLLGPVMSMMRRGMLVDETVRLDTLRDLKKKQELVNDVLQEFAKIVWGKELNPNSYPQLKAFFYEALRCAPVVSYKKGEARVAVDRDALEKLAKDYVRAKPIAKAITRLRDISKEIELLSKGLDENNRFLYSFNIGGTETGRYSSSSHPYRLGSNGQNLTPDLRHIFIPDKGKMLVSCDLQGAEARAVAYLSGDEAYIKALESGDVHTMVAAMVWGFEPKRELAERKFYRDFSYRDMAKKYSHGSSYGGSARTLATQTKTEIALAEDFQDKFFDAFPGLKDWQAWTAKQLQEKGYLITPFGRKRVFWNRRWDDSTVREAIAYVPQSFIGDYCHVQEYNIWYNFEPEVQLLLNGHDSVVFQMDFEAVDTTLPAVLECMKIEVPVTDIKGVTRKIVIPTDAKIGLNYGEREEKDKNGNPLPFDEIVNPTGLRKWSPPSKIS